MHAKIADRDLQTWADYLIDYSLGGLRPEDVVMLKGEPITWPLLTLLQDKVFAAGAVADLCLVAPDNDRGKVWGAAIARHGTVEQIARVPDWQRARYESMTKYVEVLGAERPELFADLPEETAQAVVRGDEPIKSIRLLKPWVITLYPTAAFAEMEGMTLDEYTEVIVSASTTDPRRLEETERPIHQAMTDAQTMRIVTRRPGNTKDFELSLSIGDHQVVKCTGRRNFPDGEVFTSPDARTTEGEIFVDMPVFQGGTVIEGVYLRFEDGQIRDYSATRGQDALAKIVETDEGSRRLGEVALGMNAGISRVLRHPLFVEKVGGTFHLAIGASYPECFVADPSSEKGRAEADELHRQGILNRSAQHVDIVTDFRGAGSGQAVYLDDTRLEVRDRIWVVP